MSHAATHESHFLVIDQGSVNANWDGSPTTLNPNDNINLPQTTNGSLVLAYQNTSTTNNNGTLSVTSGGSAPQFLPAPAGLNQPNILVNNWLGNNLSLTNISLTGSKTPIWVAAVGPGLPGVTPVKLPTDGSLVTLTSGKSAQGIAIPRWMQLILQATSGDLTVFAVIGGPADSTGNNAYVIALNAVANTGPNTGVAPPAGYYATTTANTFTFQFNWGSSNVFVANESPSTAAAATVSIRAL
jgi:hypothetical protein